MLDFYMQRIGDDLPSFSIIDRQMDVIRSHHVIQHTQAKPFSGLKKPIDPSLTITSKLQEKLPLVTTMRQVPDLSSQIMPVALAMTKFSS
jgi:hypothetical protein